jgi:hypothetical protein
MRFEQYLVQRLRESLDVNTHPTSASGAGLDKNDIRIPSLNIEIEAKNAATFNLQADWDQTKAQKTSGNIAILAIRHPKQPEFKESIVCMDLEDFIALAQNQGGKQEVSFTANSQDRWKLQKLVDSAKEVIKLYKQNYE